jgi:1-acyl-sn-glycerol-3-phosphate acyltransferase
MTDSSSLRDSTWARRTITVGGVLFGGFVVAPLTLLALPLMALVDLVSGRPRLPTPRVALFGLWYLMWEWVAVFSSAALWIASGFGLLLRTRFFEDRHRQLQVVWAHSLWRAMDRLLGLRLHIVGEEHMTPGPMVCFARHASLVDTLIPIQVFSAHDIGCRYVLKSELLWDPALDIIGQRFPNYFVDRSGRNTAAELANISALAAGMSDDEAFVIFPEGSRFTPEKRARAVEKLRDSDPELGALADKLTQTMPPRAGGPMAGVDGCPEADIVVMAHTGLEGLASLKSLIRSAPFRRPVEVECWRIPRSEVPEGVEERREWLFRTWGLVDDWVAEHRRD